MLLFNRVGRDHRWKELEEGEGIHLLTDRRFAGDNPPSPELTWRSQWLEKKLYIYKLENNH